MKKLINLLNWLDYNLVKIITIGFIFIAPLYPKFPIKIVNYTYIAVRAEDFYIAFAVVIFLIQLLRKRVELNTKFLKLILIFWGAVFIAFLFGAFIQNTVIYKHLGFLHSARRVEYMIIFFLAASTVKSKKDFYVYLYTFLSVALLVCLYGIGQKYLQWPAVQTMNPEFAKGHILYLTPEARVSSTFGGHYDLAAFLVFFMPIALAYYLSKGRRLLYILFIIAVFVLVLTASRVSFVAYAVSTLAFLVFLKKPKLLLLTIVITVILSLATKTLTARFFQTIQIKQIFVNEQTGQVVVPQKISTKELPAGTFYVDIDKNNKKPKVVKQETQALLNQTLIDTINDEASKSGRILTASEASSMAATMEANLTAVNTVVSDISLATRLQVEWPRAIKAFLSNPLLGTGPSSITESTDSDFLRWIGEFGLLGTGAFLFLLYSIVLFFWKSQSSLKETEKYLYLGYIFGLGGLLINATYIDVFEASKVAYSFWLTTGFFVGYLTSYKPKKVSEKKQPA